MPYRKPALKSQGGGKITRRVKKECTVGKPGGIIIKDCEMPPLLFVVGLHPYVEVYFNPEEILYVVKHANEGWALGFKQGEFQITEEDAQKILKKTGVVRL